MARAERHARRPSPRSAAWPTRTPRRRRARAPLGVRRPGVPRGLERGAARRPLGADDAARQASPIRSAPTSRRARWASTTRTSRRFWPTSRARSSASRRARRTSTSRARSRAWARRRARPSSAASWTPSTRGAMCRGSRRGTADDDARKALLDVPEAARDAAACVEAVVRVAAGRRERSDVAGGARRSRGCSARPERATAIPCAKLHVAWVKAFAARPPSAYPALTVPLGYAVTRCAARDGRRPRRRDRPPAGFSQRRRAGDRSVRDLRRRPASDVRRAARRGLVGPGHRRRSRACLRRTRPTPAKPPAKPDARRGRNREGRTKGVGICQRTMLSLRILDPNARLLSSSPPCDSLSVRRGDRVAEVHFVFARGDEGGAQRRVRREQSHAAIPAQDGVGQSRAASASACSKSPSACSNGVDRAVGLVALDVGLGRPLPRDPDVIDALVRVGRRSNASTACSSRPTWPDAKPIGQREPEQLPRLWRTRRRRRARRGRCSRPLRAGSGRGSAPPWRWRRRGSRDGSRFSSKPIAHVRLAGLGRAASARRPRRGSVAACTGSLRLRLLVSARHLAARPSGPDRRSRRRRAP